MSTDYYTRLEQGRPIAPSAQVIDALARALDLDDAGLAYLRTLSHASSRPSPPRRTVQRLRPGVHQLLESFATQPALVLGHRTDILASNRLARALFTDFEALPAAQRNYARWMLLDQRAHTLFVDWEEQARHAADALRLQAAATPNDAGLQQLVGELSLASAEFRRWWPEHRVHRYTHGTKSLRHPAVGALEVQFESLPFPDGADQMLYVYTTEPGSASSEALALLASRSLPHSAHRS